MDSEILKKNFKLFASILIIFLIAFILIDNLTFFKTIRQNELVAYSTSKIRLENLPLKEEQVEFVMEKPLDYGRALVFRTPYNYHLMLYKKGRLTNKYNLEHNIMLDLKSINKTEYFSFYDSVYNYNFSINFKDMDFKLIDKNLNFDYSSIVLVVISVMAYIFLRMKNKEYIENHGEEEEYHKVL